MINAGMTADVARRIVHGLVWGVQKARSDLAEAIGWDAPGMMVLEDLHPFLFGPDNVLPHLIDWQKRITEAGEIKGADLYNWVTWINLKDPAVVISLELAGFEVPERADPSWMLQTWPAKEAS